MATMLPLSDRVIAVTGAGRGIGRSVVEHLLERGAKVAALDVVLGEDMALLDNETALAIQCDVTDEASVISAFDQIVSHFGRLDGLVNNAGIIMEKPLAETTMDDFDSVVGVNLRGSFACGKVAAGIFQNQREKDPPDYDPSNPPRIVNIASELGHSGMANYSAYAATKGGIYSMTRSWALELAPHVLVNNVAPGPTDTPMLQSETQYEEWKLGKDIPLGRLAHPSDIAKAVCFLQGPDAGFITGSTIDVNGGAVMV